jgi:hypothetical protein
MFELSLVTRGFLLAAGFGISQMAALYIVEYILPLKIRLQDPTDTS